MSGRNSRNNRLNRREFMGIGGTLAAALGFAQWKLLSRNKVKKPFQLKRKIPGSIKGASHQVGHWIREAQNRSPSSTVHTKTAIVGSGISALSAAWWLTRNNERDFLIFELEKKPGGNSQSDENSQSKFPWGAHYLPLPTNEARYVQELLQEAGVVEGRNAQGLPIYKEEYLCHDPKERLFIEGIWQDNLIPSQGISPEGHAELERFLSLVETYKHLKGADGRPAFTIPAELSSRDPQLLALDGISMAEYLEREGFRSKELRWYVDYGCRDDYGARANKISAWVGLQYFCARSGKAANAEENSVLTWPEGNGWIVNYYQSKFPDKIRQNSLVTSVRVQANGAEIDVLNTQTLELTRVLAKHVIYSAPRFTAPYIVRDEVSRQRIVAPKIEYDPWLVANVTLNSKPKGKGAPLSWDNVSYYSDSLGYVVANHQSLRRFDKNTVLTFYWPLDQGLPKEERERALKRDHASWSEQIVQELEAMHPGIEPFVQNIDVWIWGHAMARPAPGFLWSAERQNMQKDLHGVLHFAHSDMTGYSIFEEAQYWGIEAAKKILKSQRATGRIGT